MDIKIVDDQGKEVKTEVKTESKDINTHQELVGAVLPQLEVQAVAEVMGLDPFREAGKYSDKIDTLLEWAKTKTTDHSIESLKSVIRGLELKLGTPSLAEKKIDYVSRYAYLALETQKIRKEQQSLMEKRV